MFGRLARTGMVCVAGVISGWNGSKLSEFEIFLLQVSILGVELVEMLILSYSQS